MPIFLSVSGNRSGFSKKNEPGLSMSTRAPPLLLENFFSGPLLIQTDFASLIAAPFCFFPLFSLFGGS